MSEHSIETIELELAILVRRVTSVTSDRKNRNLDRAAYLLLHQVSARGLSGVKTLADEFQLDVSTVSRQAAVLEKKGYLYKVPDPQDGRAYFYQITEMGENQLVEYKQARINSITTMLNDWSNEERQSFGHLLKKFNLALSER